MNQRIYAIYYLEISDDYKEKPFTLIMIDKSLNGYYKEIYPGKYQYILYLLPCKKEKLTHYIKYLYLLSSNIIFSKIILKTMRML